MSGKQPEVTRHGDYSLVGADSAAAVEKGLAEARWYTPEVPRAQMRDLLRRRDGPALADTALWFLLLFGFGAGGFLLWGTAWAIIPFALYGVIYASTSDSRWHEAGHGTAFRTDWLNNALYEIASFMVLRESVIWRWSHTRHHSDTIIVGRDPEIAVPRPVKLVDVLLKFVNGKTWPRYAHRVALHCTGRLTTEELTFVPESEHGKVVVHARIYALIYLGVVGLALGTGSILPLMYVGLPNLYGAWLMVIYGLTQHAGLAENVLDHRLNTRTVYMNRVHRYLYWNMGYHIEHHLFPLVPYHALPRLHALIRTDLPAPYEGLLAAYREIIPTLLRQRTDAAYYVHRELPAARPEAPAPAEAQAAGLRFTGEGKDVADGWIEICEGRVLGPEDVLRFDHAGRTYAVYRLHDGKVYATEGACTHGNAHLADGLVKGTLIECPKHNGRFDVRDGSPQRPPVCVGLKTYAVAERDGKLRLNLLSAAGAGSAELATVYAFRVVSNEQVAAFIKELVLERDPGSPAFVYQPGDYIQLDIPAYPERTLAGVAVPAAFAAAWQAQGVFALAAANPLACRRNYSLASNPAADRDLRFNVRLALPPAHAAGSAGAGSSFPAGAGSSYVFGLQPGDRVTAIGPLGSFHIRENGREMVYLGGGAGMAPLRSHLSYLFETQQTGRRVSFWYGARSLQESLYRAYFEDLARQRPNFTFHMALSAPRPEDGWTGATGYIHEVLKREYLDGHPDPKQIDYYLCGPLPMIRAAGKMLTDLGVPPAQILSDEF
ncbi:MAG TPA: fatty acid desaturase [Anaerolineae bacterium]